MSNTRFIVLHNPANEGYALKEKSNGPIVCFLSHVASQSIFSCDNLGTENTFTATQNSENITHSPKAFKKKKKSQNRKFQAIETHQYICLKIFWNNNTVQAYPDKQTMIKADVLLTSEKHIVNLVNIL